MPDEFATRLYRLQVAVDNVLIAQHALRSHLKPGFPPFLAIGEDGRLQPMPSTVGLRYFGPGPLFDLWIACCSAEWLRLIWTGEPSHDAPRAIPIPDNPEDNHATATAAAPPAEPPPAAAAAVDPSTAATLGVDADPPGVATN
jgi:hypothetical protein